MALKDNVAPRGGKAAVKSGEAGAKGKRAKTKKPSFKGYTRLVLDEINHDRAKHGLGAKSIKGTALAAVVDAVDFYFNLIAATARRVQRHGQRKTLGHRELECAVKLISPVSAEENVDFQLGHHLVSAAANAVTAFNLSKAADDDDAAAASAVHA